MPSDDQLAQHVLLTGATGRVGARFLPLLRRSGAQVRLMVWGPDPGRPGGASLVMGDLRDPEVCRRAVTGMDAVVHIASAFQGVTVAEAVDLNYRATVALATQALAAGVDRFVQLSSCLVYGPGRGRPAREDDEPRPPTGATFPAAKLAAERAVGEFTGTALRVCVLRVAFTYGEGDPHLADALAWAGRAQANARLHLVHHADVRQSVLRALRTGGEISGRTYNVADDAPVTAAELRCVADGFPVPAGDDGERSGYSASQRSSEASDAVGIEADSFGGEVDTTAVRRDLGYRPIYPSIQDAHQAGRI